MSAAVRPGSSRRGRVGAQATLFVLAVIWLIPIVMVLSISLMPSDNRDTLLGGLIVSHPSLDNYRLIWSENPITRNLLNSVIISVPTVALVTLLGALAAFALAKLRFIGRGVVFWVLVMALVLPTPSVIVALFQITKELGLYNSYLALILPYTALGIPFAVVIFRGFFNQIPDALAEAARLDGASWWRTFRSIYLPLSKPAMAVVVIWEFMISWNEFLIPLVMLEDNDLKPLTLVPLAYQGLYLSQPGALFAVLVLITLPVVVVYMAMQRYMVRGLAGAVK